MPSVANRCIVRTWLISPEREVRPADREKWEKNWQILRGTVQAEDFPMARTIQQGFHSGAQLWFSERGRVEGAVGRRYSSTSCELDLRRALQKHDVRWATLPRD